MEDCDWRTVCKVDLENQVWCEDGGLFLEDLVCTGAGRPLLVDYVWIWMRGQRLEGHVGSGDGGQLLEENMWKLAGRP